MAGGRTVILGGGFAGVTTALQLADRVQDEDILIVDADGRHVYTPWLYELATGFLASDKQSSVSKLMHSSDLSISSIIKKANTSSIRFRKATVKKIDPSGHVLLAGGKTLKFDRCVVALGSQAESFGIPGIKEHAYTMRSVEDAAAVRERLHQIVMAGKKVKRVQTVMIGGAGATGVETAGELANFLKTCQKNDVCELGTIRLILLDAAPTILSQFSPRVRTWAQKRLIQLGVEIFTDTVVTHVSKDRVTVKPRQMSDDELCAPHCPFQEPTDIEIDLFIWTGGIKPNEVLENFPLPKDKRGRIKVTPTLQVEGHERIFAIGDASALLNPKTDRLVPPAAYSAIKQAKLAAENLSASIQGRALQPYRFKRSSSWVIPVGGRYGVASLGPVAFAGLSAFCLRRLIDLRYFLSILPAKTAWKFWRGGIDMFENND